jgi:hypothetical protein
MWTRVCSAADQIGCLPAPSIVKCLNPARTTGSGSDTEPPEFDAELKEFYVPFYEATIPREAAGRGAKRPDKGSGSTRFGLPTAQATLLHGWPTRQRFKWRRPSPQSPQEIWHS